MANKPPQLKSCSAEGCDNKTYCRGLCEGHYTEKRLRDAGYDPWKVVANCWKCGARLKIGENWYPSNAKDNRKLCNDCVNAYIRKYYKAHSKETKARSAAYYKANRESILLAMKTYRSDPANRERIRKYLKEWGERNRDYKHRKDREYYHTNREDVLARMKAAHMKNIKAAIGHYSNGTMACSNPYGIHKKPFTVLDALTLDHINNDAAQASKAWKGRALYDSIAYQVKATGKWPTGFQVLCMGCNVIKAVEHCREGMSPERVRLSALREESKRRFVEHYSNGTMACADPYGIHEKFDGGRFTNIRGLSGDHVDGKGSTWRRRHHTKSGVATYRYARLHGWPDGFQILCMSCQQIKKKRNGEHKKQGAGPR